MGASKGEKCSLNQKGSLPAHIKWVSRDELRAAAVTTRKLFVWLFMKEQDLNKRAYEKFHFNGNCRDSLSRAKELGVVSCCKPLLNLKSYPKPMVVESDKGENGYPSK